MHSVCLLCALLALPALQARLAECGSVGVDHYCVLLHALCSLTRDWLVDSIIKGKSYIL